MGRLVGGSWKSRIATTTIIYFLYVLINVVTQVVSQVPPGPPTIDGPDVLVRGETIVLTCTSTGGNPTPTVKWFRDAAEITEGISTSTSGSTVTTTLTFVVTVNEHYKVLECQADNGVLQNPLTITKFVLVHYTPDSPVLTGPTSLVAGDPGTWTCTSANGYPAGTMTLKNTNTGTTFQAPAYSVTTTAVSGGRSFTVTGTLNWSPALSNNNHQLCCEVAHRTTISIPQSVCLTLAVRVPPGPPTIDGPDVLVRGETIVLTCTSTGGNPTPTVKWFRDAAEITEGISTSTSGSTVTTTLTFVVTVNEHYKVLECQADNGVLQNPLKITKFVFVHYTPDSPVLTGPTSLVAGDPGTWTCTSANGYPAGTMTLKNTNTSTAFGPPEYSVTSTPVNGGRSFTVTGTLNWSPAMSNNNHQLCCEVAHPTTISIPQSVCLTLAVRAPLAVNAPVTSYTPIIGDSVTLQCVVTFGTATSITWFKGITVLNTVNTSRYSNGDVKNPSLTISGVQQSDAGDYTCQAYDGSVTVSTNNINVDALDKQEQQISLTFIAVISAVAVALVISIILNVTFCLKRRTAKKSSRSGQRERGSRQGTYDTPSDGESNPHFYDETDTYDRIPGQENISNDIFAVESNETRPSSSDYQAPIELYHKYIEVI